MFTKMLISLSLVILCCSGCSTGRDYWQNRLDDAKDIISAEAGSGVGIKVYAFGLQVDFYNFSPSYGIRGGEVFSRRKHDENYHISEGNIGIPWLFVNADIFYPGERAVKRGKAYCGVTPFVPFFYLTDGAEKSMCNECSWKLKFAANRYCREKTENGKTETEEKEIRKKFYEDFGESREYGGAYKLKISKRAWNVYTDLHFVIALGKGIRFGINPGELLDFICGWFMLDIFGDDL